MFSWARYALNEKPIESEAQWGVRKSRRSTQDCCFRQSCRNPIYCVVGFHVGFCLISCQGIAFFSAFKDSLGLSLYLGTRPLSLLYPGLLALWPAVTSRKPCIWCVGTFKQWTGSFLLCRRTWLCGISVATAFPTKASWILFLRVGSFNCRSISSSWNLLN